MLSVADPRGRGLMIEKFIDVAKVRGRCVGSDGREV